MWPSAELKFGFVLVLLSTYTAIVDAKVSTGEHSIVTDEGVICDWTGTFDGHNVHLCRYPNGSNFEYLTHSKVRVDEKSLSRLTADIDFNGVVNTSILGTNTTIKMADPQLKCDVRHAWIGVAQDITSSFLSHLLSEGVDRIFDYITNGNKNTNHEPRSVCRTIVDDDGNPMTDGDGVVLNSCVSWSKYFKMGDPGARQDFLDCKVACNSQCSSGLKSCKCAMQHAAGDGVYDHVCVSNRPKGC